MILDISKKQETFFYSELTVTYILRGMSDSLCRVGAILRQLRIYEMPVFLLKRMLIIVYHK